MNKQLIERLQQKILTDPPDVLRLYHEDLTSGLGVDESAKRSRERTAQQWVETIAEELWVTGAQWSANWLRTGDGENKK